MATREQILDTTSTLFLERGCKVVTMDDVASANGMSKRTLYEMFADKSSLLEECIVRYYFKKHEAIRKFSLQSDNVLEMFIRVADNDDDSLMNLHRNFFKEVRRYYPETYENLVKRLSQDQYESIEEAMKRGQNEGVFIDRLSSRVMTIALLQFSNSIAESELAETAGMNLFQYIREIMIHVIRGFATEKGIRIIDEYYSKKKKK